jgi:S1-C subfamily serine protease
MAAAARDCAYLRRVSVAQYNDCLRQEVANTASAGDDGALAVASKAIDAPDTRSAAAIVPVVAANLPPPRSVLQKRPNHIDHQTLSAAEIYKKVERSVFVVIAAQSVADLKLRNILQGSAVAVSDHLLLTNCHVVKDRPIIHIVQDQTIAEARVVAGDFTADRCILQSEGAPVTPIAGVRPFTDLAIGERVFAIGSPRALERTLSDGIISGLRHDKTRGDLVQTSAAISPGSSGGGLFDDRGNLVGITSFHVNGAQNLDFAIAAAGYWE